MSWSGTVQIHGVSGTGYPDAPKLYSTVEFGDITRSGDTISCTVSASLNKSGSAWFGYHINVYAQLDEGEKVLLYTKPNRPKTWSANVYKGSGTIKSNNTSESATLKILFESNCGGPCWSAGTAYTMWSQSVTAPPYAPPNITLTKDVYGSTYLKWNCTSDVDCDKWVYSIDGGAEIAYTGNSKSAPGALYNLTSQKHSVYVKGHRVNGKWGTSSTVTWDCSVPQINNFQLTPVDNTHVDISFTSDYDVDYYWNNVKLGTTVNKSGKARISITENTTVSGTLKIVRTDNTNITNSAQKSLDMTYAKIQLTGIVNALDVSFDAVTSDMCKDWYAILTWTIDGTKYTRRIEGPSGDTTYWKEVISGLEPNVKYEIVVYATKVSNNVSSASNKVSATPTGCIRIFDSNNTAKGVGVWIWVETDTFTGWRVAVPYVYSEADQVWKMSI